MPILILRRSRTIFHHGALGIARSAGRLGIPVYGFHEDRWAPASLSRYSTGRMVGLEHADDERCLEALRRFRREHGRAVLVPIDDAGSVFVDRQGAELSEDFLFPAAPSGLAAALSSKREMHRLCNEHGVATPESWFPGSEAEVRAQSRFPVVAKVIDASRLQNGAPPRVVIAPDSGTLLDAYRRMALPDGSNVMLQEYVPGGPESVWMFNGYFDADSECRIGFTGRKLRQSPPYTGATTLGVCLPCPPVEESTRRLMKAVGYRGVLDIGYRFDARDGRYKLLDVNPRIGATFRLFVGQDGSDVLRAMYLDLTGAEVPASRLDEGRRWVVEPLDLASALTYRRRGDITVGQWLRSFRGVREAAWFAADDPLPWAAMWARLLFYRVPRRALARLSRRG